MHDLESYLYDLKLSCRNILEFVGEMSLVEYSVNLMAKRAVEREFEIIGEILRRVRDIYPDCFSMIPDAKRIIDFRNLIAHGYDSLSDDRVYSIVKSNLPRFLDDLERL